ncbi:hypothetical protein B0T22DRAFT_455521 [Podospora appendiculata]|uniref:Thioredoxin domain-containing protein n=1 Tax=Podospora appendiculata TaxID=314037 RepID=A0AAE0XLB7_9PEZI|nr:hypothetical protein B0T22DRAFT_455521 [Podospora appendiculata]
MHRLLSLGRPALHGRLLPKPQAAFVCSGGSVSRSLFSTSRKAEVPNQVYNSVRNLDQFHTYQLLSSSSRTPLLTLWTTSYCSTCGVVAPLIRELVESGIGEEEGGVGYCEVEYDAPDIMSAGLGLTYMIHSVPTLLSFDAQEAQTQTKVTDARKLSDPKFLEEWIRNEARRQGNRGAGGGTGLGDFFSGLLGKK